MCNFGSVERYANPDLDVTLAYGDNTFKGVRTGIPVWKRAFPKHHIVEIPGAGHETIREAPRALAEILFGTEPVT
jgi:pimeloyl-ACP methyl ester carboxylesterase